MRSLVYSFALSIFIVCLWCWQTTNVGLYNILEITAPPSAYGPPKVFLRVGSDIIEARQIEETYSATPSPTFIDRYIIFQNPVDEMRVLSNLPQDRVNQISARLCTADGLTLVKWDHAAFGFTSLETAKAVLRPAIELKDLFDLGTKLPVTTWSPPRQETHSWLTLFVAQFVLSVLFIVLFRFLPLYRISMRHFLRILGGESPVAKGLSPLKLSLFCLGILSLISVSVWLLFGTFYGTADDPFMTLVVKGYLMKHPDWHLFFMHPVVGYILMCLYASAPNIPWYVLCMTSLNLISLSAILYAVLRRSFTLIRLILYAVIIFLPGVYIIACVQFTMVSCMACFAGIALLVGNAGQSAISKIRLATAIGFFVLGTAIRFQPALLMLILSTPCIIYLWYNSSLPGARRFFLSVFCGLIFLTVTEKAAYQIFPEWREARAYDAVRGMLNDTEAMKNYEANADIYQAVNWSKNDWEMFNFMLYTDAKVFSKEKLTYLVTHLRHPSPEPNQGFWTIFHDLSTNFHPIILYFVWLAFAFTWRLMTRLQILTLLVPFVTVICCLALYIRLPERVLRPTLFMEPTMLLLLASGLNFQMKLRTILFGGLFLIVLTSSLLISLIAANYHYGRYVMQREQSTVNALTSLSTPAAPIIVGTICKTSSEQTFLWQNYPELKELRILQPAWFETPVYNQRLERLGLTNAFLDLAQRHDMVLDVAREDFSQVVCLEAFMREHYGIPVKFEVAKIPGTNQDAIFPYFTLFKATL